MGLLPKKCDFCCILETKLMNKEFDYNQISYSKIKPYWIR